MPWSNSIHVTRMPLHDTWGKKLQDWKECSRTTCSWMFTLVGKSFGRPNFWSWCIFWVISTPFLSGLDISTKWSRSLKWCIMVQKNWIPLYLPALLCHVSMLGPKNVRKANFGVESCDVLSICGEPVSSNELISMYFSLLLFQFTFKWLVLTLPPTR